MKHHIAVKFLAVVLCAAFLFTAAASGIGAICLTEANLYEQTPEELYSESVGTLAEVFARQIATNYASQTLGGCPEEMTDNYVHFNAGYYGYTLRDAEGNVLLERELEDYTGARSFTFPVADSYMRLISISTRSDPEVDNAVPSHTDLQVYDNIPADGVYVDTVWFTDETGNTTCIEGSKLGVLSYNANGNVIYQALQPDEYLPEERLITHAAFSYSDITLFEITCSDGVGIFRYDDDGCLRIVFYTVYDNIPANGTAVGEMNVTFSHGGSEACGTDGVLGYLSHQDDGSVLFVSEDDAYFFSENGPVSHVAFYGLNGELLYEATGENGGIVGEVFPDYNDGLVFLSELTYLDDPTENTVAFTEAPLNTPATEMPTEAPTEAPTDAGYVLYNAIPSQGAYVGNVCYTDRNSSSTFSISTQTGFLSYNADGAVIFRTIHPSPVLPDGDTFYQIAFYGTDGTLLYEASREAGVGQFYLDENGYLYFTSCMEALSAEAEAPTAEYIPPITIPDTTTATEVVDTPVDIPRETIIAELTDPTEVPDATVATMPAMDIPDETTAALDFSDEIISTYYYDHDLGQQVQATFIYEDMPETYTVELYLLPGAYEMDAVYDLIVWIWGYRNEMLYVLGVSLFLFAVCAVYLCCSAGRKPGREEIRAGGFNCLSLDVYLGAGGLAVCGLAIIGFEGGYYLLRYSPQLLAPFVIIMGYSAALIIVGFCFACAAQFKTPGGYWWKNTLTVRCFNLGIQLVRWCVRYFFRFMRWLEEFLGKLFPQLGRIMKYCWKTFIQLCLAVYRYTEKGLTWAGHFLGGVFRSVSAWIHRFLVLLPVTWQWLIIGGMLLFVLFLAILTRSEFFIVLGVLAGLALIIYGSHCFGILLESTKRMGKGDLETKVDDKLMVGAFREFAGDLNNLADVAVIAAQKQMKSERMKAELITNVSHDIKTPLTSIINYVDLLQKPHTDEEQETYLEVLSRQSQQMKKLLEDLIEMSKASTGNMTVNISRINAGEAVTQALGEFAGKLETAQLTTVVHQPEDAVYMQADGRLVWRVLSNLLSNAVKYALPGTRVYIDVMELDGKVLISMKNISREALNVSADELMERFVRGDASRNTEGSGLGLNIAQSLMEIQKGKLQLLVDGDLFKVTLVFPGANE